MAQMHLTLGPRVGRLVGPLVVTSHTHATRGVHEGTAPDPSLAASGPGWFESSFELGRGLEVREGLPANLGLSEWLTLCLGNARPGLL